ncbi:hypothetical protein ABEP17_17610 [Priestia flexa]|uniref:Uncharacterized protein n=1 Tax=Priestia flexa TaxID=86664 RepID=A0ABU4JC11_9BACI|nr:hypothetical protein [Priestia flexa]AQX54653.1 hypothetical protein BC359_10245 [Priestia flexa]MCA1201874.1 hypothetical protein [Priestia flexa]MCG7313801.1 hypothetical protein [Priestia flexa]MCM3067843.1 hypothetical protein [Priestia flexa]MCP1189549.1 hypothetical protein [Priestia flexa]
MKTSKTKEMTLMAMLAVLIAVSGMFKIPSPFVGTEFQLSAPIAIVIAATFGFKRYFCAGIVASIISLLLGTHTLIHVLVAMIFRLVAGGIIGLFGTALVVVMVAGPLGTIAARYVLAAIMDVDVTVLLLAALPGMVFTAISSGIMYPIIKRNMKSTIFQEFVVDDEKKGEPRKYESI